jgi:hypothetical protein
MATVETIKDHHESKGNGAGERNASRKKKWKKRKKASDRNSNTSLDGAEGEVEGKTAKRHKHTHEHNVSERASVKVQVPSSDGMQDSSQSSSSSIGSIGSTLKVNQVNARSGGNTKGGHESSPSSSSSGKRNSVCNAHANTTGASASATSAWAFETDYNDHFETPTIAYTDVSPAFAELCKLLGKVPQDLVIYDPYFCQGKMRQRLKDIGYPTVINENRDFYADVKKKRVPGTIMHGHRPFPSPPTLQTPVSPMVTCALPTSPLPVDVICVYST